MNIVDFVARGLFYRTEDERIIFRPWGSFGPCFLVTEQQRTARARIQLGFYCLMLGGIAIVPSVGIFHVIAYIFVAIIFNYLMFWLFARGLPKTDLPLPPSPEHRKAQLRELSQSLGKPLLWALTISSALFTLVGVLAALFIGNWTVAIVGGLFFGACTLVFINRLRHLNDD